MVVVVDEVVVGGQGTVRLYSCRPCADGGADGDGGCFNDCETVDDFEEYRVELRSDTLFFFSE
ncbi:uncharacterized protein Bfra_006082 [Botrytis fragariae]|uniref:Uncharacterized protein n=1 Tax=Botrytis fragariae TaxID=1964551 RepID=A0A8H6ASK3_9HELO|nr:uncharacterized protein Bfra_006082 [Botrytis fragariae]KAF5872719.1 hypothetical protein Bfra_006082 [Botrytis fragariae]